MNVVEAHDPLAFIKAPRRKQLERRAVSLFSGAGIGDVGIEAAGFRIVAQVESAQRRSELAHENFPNAVAVSKPVEESLESVKAAVAGKELDLLATTPPCQGMSSSNPSRGRRDSSISEEISRKNSLLLEVVPYLNELRPKAFMAENVRQVLALPYAEGRSTVEELAKLAPDYRFWSTPINVADYGVA